LSAIEGDKVGRPLSVDDAQNKNRKIAGVIFAAAVLLALAANRGVADVRLVFLVAVFIPLLGAAAFGLEVLGKRGSRTILRRPSRRMSIGLAAAALAVYFLGVVPDVTMQSEVRGPCRSAAYALDSADNVCRRGGTSTTDWHHPGDFVQVPQDYHVAVRLTTLPVRLFALDFTSPSFRGFGVCASSPRDCR
jgi:hypothetical protein